MGFIGYCNGQSTKAECAKSTLREEITLPVRKNGFLYTGNCPEYKGKSLIVLDFDGRVNFEEEFVKDCIAETMAVKTGSGGMHLYFWGADFSPANEHNPADRLSEGAMKYGELRGIDIRGTGGKIFAPGCKFDEHIAHYYFLNAEEPATITESEFYAMRNNLIKKMPVTHKDLSVLMPTILSSTDINEICEIITKNNDKHRGSHDFWLKFALYCNYFKVQKDDILCVFHQMAVMFKAFIDDDIYDDRERAITDACSGKYDKSIGFGLQDFFSKRDLNRLAVIISKSSEKVKKALEAEDTVVYEKMAEDLIAAKKMGWEEDAKKLFFFDGKHYIIDSLEARELISQMLIASKRANNRKNIEEVIYQIQNKNHREADAFDTNLNFVVFDNGIYDTQMRSLSPNTPNYLAFIHYPVEYHPTTGDHPKFDQFLANITPNIAEQKRICLIMRDLILNRLIQQKKFVVLHGITNSGKGMIQRILSNIIGEKWIALFNIAHLGNRFAGGDLLHKKLAMDTDSTPDALNSMAVSFIKKMCGLDLIRNEKKGRDAVFTHNSSSFLFAVNRLPKLPPCDESKSVMAKAIYIKFTRTHIVDENFEAEVMAEKQAICDYLMSLSLDEKYSHLPVGSTETSEDYWRMESDPVFSYSHANIAEGSGTYNAVDVVNDVYRFLHERGLSSIGERDVREQIMSEVRKKGGVVIYKQKAGSRYVFYSNITIAGVKTSDAASVSTKYADPSVADMLEGDEEKW